MTNKIKEAMNAYWGERCSHYEPGCPTCDAWKEHDMSIKTKEEIEKYAAGFAKSFFYANADEGKDLPWQPFENWKEEALQKEMQYLTEAFKEAMLWAQTKE